MNKNKNNLDKFPSLKHKSSDLRGFEDVMDMLPPGRFSSPSGKNRKLNENFELLSLLEHEIQRIKKLDIFFNQKLRTSKNFNQTDKLIRTQKERNKSLAHEIVEKSLSTDGHFYNNFENLFKQAFTPISVKKN